MDDNDELKMRMIYDGGFTRVIDRCKETDEALRQLVGSGSGRPVEVRLVFLDDGSRRWTNMTTGAVVITEPIGRRRGELF